MLDKKANESAKSSKKEPRLTASALKRSSSIDNSDSALGTSLTNSASAFCISLQNSTDLSDEHLNDVAVDSVGESVADFHGEASGQTAYRPAEPPDRSSNTHARRSAKHSARLRSRGKSTDRFHRMDVFDEDLANNEDHQNNRQKDQKDQQKVVHKGNHLKQSGREPNGSIKPTKRATNHLTKRNSIDGLAKGINGRFIKIWIETLVGTAYEVGYWTEFVLGQDSCVLFLPAFEF